MSGIIVSLLALFFVLILCSWILSRIETRKSAETERLGDDLPEETVDDNIKRRFNPELRPYGKGGQMMADAQGKTYATVGDGSVRRVALIPQEDGTHKVVGLKKWDKARKKAEKRKRHAKGWTEGTTSC